MRTLRIGKNRICFPRKRGCHYMLLIPLLLSGYAARSQNQPVEITRTVNFDQGSPEVSVITAADNHLYSTVSWQGLFNEKGKMGNPSLPVKYIRLIVPKDKNYSAITVNAGNPGIISLQHPVFPEQYLLPTAEPAISMPFAAPNPEIYQAGAVYPAPLVQYIGEGYFDGNKHIITLAIHPVQYIPAENRLTYYRSLTFTVSENPDIAPPVHSITRQAVRLQEELYNKPLTELVDNPDQISLFANAGAATTATAGGGTEPAAGGKFKFYEYVIITSHELRPAFEELLGWKRRKGLNAGIVEIQDILSDPTYSSGDLVSGINDDAGKLRQYLSDAYQGGTVYAVLGGDSSVIPIRYATGGDNTYTYSSDEDARIPSDLYYTDFNGNWNKDNDGFYGEESGDIVDYDPEIYVGRILANTEMQVTNHVHKIIRYERNPGRGDNDYLTKLFFTQADGLLDNNEGNGVAAQLSFYAPGNVTIWDEMPGPYDPSPTGPNGTDVVNEIGRHYGMVSLFGHGSPNNIAVSTPGDNSCGPGQKQKVTFLDNPPYGLYCTPTQAGNGLDNLDDFDHLTNPYQNYPHIFYTIACETIPYDSWLKPVGTPDLGVVYTNYHKAGAAAYLGNTRYGWYPWTSSQLFSDFAQQLVAGKTQLGVAEGLSKSVFTGGYYEHFCNKTHCLIGCPEMDVWTDKPASFNASVSGSGGTITVNTGGVPGATICIMSALDDGYSSTQLTTGATSYTFSGVPADYAVCITKHNYIPFLWSQDVIVQNHDFYGTAYVGSPNDITSGENVDKSQATGPVTVKSDANVFFHADGKGNILLDRGFEVEPGAAFEAK